MLYPFIYTRTKNFDYRLLTSKSLGGISRSLEQVFLETARTMIDADNDKLKEPSWSLVKKDGYIFWGMAILNEVLGVNYLDKANRPIRGFFGIVSDGQINQLPYDISFFKEMYRIFVDPIWDSYDQVEQITAYVPSLFGNDVINQSTILRKEINLDNGICRVFPFRLDSKGLIEAVFTSYGDASIATNVHNKRNCIEYGRERLSFMNVVMASNSRVRVQEDVKVFIKEMPWKINHTPNEINDNPYDDTSFIDDRSYCQKCGKPIFGEDPLCGECKHSQDVKGYIKYALYGFVALICVWVLAKCSSSIMRFSTSGLFKSNIFAEDTRVTKNTDDKVVSSITEVNSNKNNGSELNVGLRNDNIDQPFITTNKSEMHVEDTGEDNCFHIKYKSSSPIIKVEPSEGIHINKYPVNHVTTGDIEFFCEPLANGPREGFINIINEQGLQLTVKIYQN